MGADKHVTDPIGSSGSIHSNDLIRLTWVLRGILGRAAARGAVASNTWAGSGSAEALERCCGPHCGESVTTSNDHIYVCRNIYIYIYTYIYIYIWIIYSYSKYVCIYVYIHIIIYIGNRKIDDKIKNGKPGGGLVRMWLIPLTRLGRCIRMIRLDALGSCEESEAVPRRAAPSQALLGRALAAPKPWKGAAAPHCGESGTTSNDRIYVYINI